MACAVQAAGAFKDGVFFVRLDDTQPTKEAVAAAIGVALGMTDDAILPERLLASLRHKEMLVVLDNYESVDSEAAAQYLADLVTQTHALRLLVTGREAVKLSDVEQVLTLEGMTDEEAAQLFLVRAQAKKRGWQPTPDEHQALRRILTLTDRIPLALELAAAWVDKRSLTAIANGLAATPLLDAPPRTRLSNHAERHRSLTRCLDWSFDLLEVVEQEGLARLGVFADTFTAHTARAVCDLPDAQALLDRLQDAALLSVSHFEADGRNRYTMLRPTRAYATEKLDALGNALALPVRQGFVAYFRQLVDDMDIDDGASLAVFDAEWRNIFGALACADTLNNYAAYRAIAAAVDPFVRRRWLLAEYEPLLLRAVQISATTLGPEHPDVAMSLNNLAGLYHAQGRYSEAEPLLQRTLTLRERVFGPEHPNIAASLNSLAGLYYAQGRYSEAEPLLQRALTLAEQVLGPEHPDVAASFNSLALLYYAQGRYSEAEPLYKRALTLLERVLGPEHPDVATSLNSLAVLYYAQGHYSEAEPLFQRTLTLLERVFGPEHPNIAASLNNLALLYDTQGRYSEAEPLFQRALALRERVLGPEHPDVATSLNSLAGLYYAQGRYSEAEPLFQLALTLAERVLGPEHPDVAILVENYAALLRAVNRHAEAARLENRVQMRRSTPPQ